MYEIFSNVFNNTTDKIIEFYISHICIYDIETEGIDE